MSAPYEPRLLRVAAPGEFLLQFCWRRVLTHHRILPAAEPATFDQEARVRWHGKLHFCLRELTRRGLYDAVLARELGNRLATLGTCRMAFAGQPHSEPFLDRKVVTDPNWVYAVRTRCAGGLLLPRREPDPGWEQLFGDPVEFLAEDFPVLPSWTLPRQAAPVGGPAAGATGALAVTGANTVSGATLANVYGGGRR